MFERWSKRRQERIDEARAATARSERMALVIGQLYTEASHIGSWAHARYEANHLTDLFHRGRASR